MKRAHLFEFCDLDRGPPALRRYTPTFLEAAFRVTRWYQVAVAPLAQALRQSGARRIVDLGSGSGGPVVLVQELLSAREGLRIPVVLTDKQPVPEALEAAQHRARRTGGELDFLTRSVDASAVPAELDGFRTMFQSFHHFRPAVARSILKDAVDRRVGIAIFEVTQRDLLGLLTLLLVPFAVLLFTPFVRPLSVGRLLLTYLVPVTPLVVWWDAFVSVLRSYTQAELRQMVGTLGSDGDGSGDYDWRLGSGWQGPQRISWLIGTPRAGQDGSR